MHVHMHRDVKNIYSAFNLKFIYSPIFSYVCEPYA